MLLETPRLILRRWRPEDRAPFAALNADPKVMEFFPACLTRDESEAMADAIDAHFNEHGYGLYALELKGTGAFIGYAGLKHIPWEVSFTPAVEMGWRIDSKYWGNGYVPEAAREAAHYGLTVLKLPELLSFTVPMNMKSRRVMEKIGMTQDKEGDFAHPMLPKEHALSRHVLYRLKSYM